LAERKRAIQAVRTAARPLHLECLGASPAINKTIRQIVAMIVVTMEANPKRSVPNDQFMESCSPGRILFLMGWRRRMELASVSRLGVEYAQIRARSWLFGLL
jgi:hypothetical protein